MDFEEQLQKAEKSPYPSLVGASVKSADDSPHNNYIHPEKYTGVLKQKHSKKSLFNPSIGASLDDLINEGALLGSEEDFDKFLDDKGNVLSDAKYTASKGDQEDKAEAGEEAAKEKVSEAKTETEIGEEKTDAGSESSQISGAVASVTGSTGEPEAPSEKPVFQATISGEEADSAPASLPASSTDEKAEIYSNPNLSEYQIGHQIADHSQLLDSVKSYDLSRLPSTEDAELRSKTSDFHGAPERTPIRPNFARSNSAFANNKTDHGSTAQVLERDSLHSPYFHTNDERSSSRSRARSSFSERSADRSRSRSRSAMSAAHLARGDSYKSTHGESPMKYELPADMLVDEEDEEDETEERRSRQSKPTLGDSLAAVEAAKVPTFAPVVESVTKEPSLVTSGDYTNFNAESLESLAYGLDVASVRSESSRNYLRSISRSRSRKPSSHLHHEINEKNDSNTDELTREGALVSDDPYLQVDNIDDMMKQVLLSSTERSQTARSSTVSEKAHEGPKDTPDLLQDSEAKINKSVTSPAANQTRANVERDASALTEIPLKASKNLISEPSVDAVTEQEDLAPSLSTSAQGERHASDGPVREPLGDAANPSVDDVSAEEKILQTEKQLHAEEAPKLSASDISLDKDIVQKATESDNVIEARGIDEKFQPSIESSAETKVMDAQSQLRTSEAPTVTASDIKIGLTEAQEEGKVDDGKENIAKDDEEKDDEGKVAKDDEEKDDEEKIAKDDDEEKMVEDGLKVEEEEKKVESNDNALLEKDGNGVPENEGTTGTETEASPSKVVSQVEDELDEDLETTGVSKDIAATEDSAKETGALDAEKESIQNKAAGSAIENEITDKAVGTEVPEESPETKGTEEGSGLEGAGKSSERETADKTVDSTATDKTKSITEDQEADSQKAESEAESGPTILSMAGAILGAAKNILPGQGPEKSEAAVEQSDESENLDVSAEELRAHLKSLPVYIYTSLAGGMQIVNRTNRLTTILQANKVAFEYRDLGTDEEAKKLWRRYAQGKTLPGVVRGDDFIGNWEYIDEVNEDYRLQEVLYETL